MNGIKLGEDMVEGKVVLNGSAHTILEIKTKDGVVWPTTPVEYYVELETYTWNPTSATQNETISVESNCTWSAVASHSWLTVTKISNTSVRFSVSANESLSQRVGTVMFQYNGQTLATFTVTQQAMEATYTLDNLEVHYTDGTSLNPDQSNYAYLTADYNTWAGSTLIDSENVVCSPEYSISPLFNEAIVTEGDYMFWDKDQYGKTEKNADYVNAYGEYNGTETEEYVRVDIGRNASETTYSYTKTFTIPSLTGPIPWDGGTFAFNASSFSQATETWTSGESQSYTPIAHLCQLSASGDVTFSTYSVSGNTTGYVTFPDNPYSSGTYDREIIMSSDDSGSESFWFEQAAREEYTYVFEGVGSRSFEPAASATSVVAHFRSYRVQDNEPMPISYRVVESELEGVYVTYSWSGIDVYATIHFDANEDASTRYAEINFIQDGTEEAEVGVVIEQQAAEDYVFEFTDHSVSKIFPVDADTESLDVYVISTKNGEYIDAEWYFTDPNIVDVTISEDGGLLLATIEFFPNETSSQRDLDITLTQSESGNVVNVTIRQGA